MGLAVGRSKTLRIWVFRRGSIHRENGILLKWPHHLGFAFSATAVLDDKWEAYTQVLVPKDLVTLWAVYAINKLILLAT